ncbi:hypothetical protein VB734_13835 [Synechococcus sp. BA-124 BA4]|uniref:hypothetical protein n=1 Tax=unclassified Synechococcus TaxID=2626047 RepID=UPI0018CC917E|nr:MULTISPECIES: hypothetical protein [unclassified Synechococcus]MEA5401117.1 hypothetical protein [Synechococcus sp. BA-124 BA4]QPN55338.1 hypothetical protein I1E95_08760 [Synechococcus sp. CBW1107]CAK6688843.1 hypothetical protein BBFGKLBO_00497 [Synechococcus sp. CBW1107]
MNLLCGWIFERGEQWMASHSGLESAGNALMAVIEFRFSAQSKLLDFRGIFMP